MKFSQIKTEEQQSLQTLETSRKFLGKELVALNNHIRAYLYEYGITLRRGRKSLRETMAIVLDDLDTRLPTCLKNTLGLLWERYKLTVEQLTEAEKYKAHLVNQLEPCQRLIWKALEKSVRPCCMRISVMAGNLRMVARHPSILG